MIVKIYLTILLLFSAMLPLSGQVLHVAVAANAQFVAGALKKAFEKQSPAKIDLIVSSSGKLTAQIKHGAPYDIFLSADMKYPEALYKSGNALTKPRAYAYGKLVLWTLKKANQSDGLKALEKPSVRTIAIANPAMAPYGIASTEAMKKADIYGSVKKKIVYGESIAQVNHYLLSGAADIAFTAESVVESPVLKGKGKWTEVPDDLYQPIKQGAVLLKHAAKGGRLKAAKAFYQLLFSRQGRAIFHSFGYGIK
jgi:molybdate transport system substrate-binding protein